MARALKLGDTQEADIVDLAHDGRGVARVDGKAVFIEGALPGERVRCRIFRRRSQSDEAILTEVLEPSAQRVVPRCAHFGVCGGCSLQHLSDTAQVAAKERHLLDSLQRIGKVSAQRVLPPLLGPAWGYRRRARLGVKYVHKKGRVLAGFRERDKPYVADLRRCEVLQQPLSDLPRDLAALVETLTIREKIPQVEVAAGDSEIALVFRVLESPTTEDCAALGAFSLQHGLQIFLQSGGLDTVRPLQPGYAPLTYAVDEGRVVIEFAPVDFIQVNREVNASMVAAAVEMLAPTAGDTVLDLFCGLGNFTLPLARRARRVVGVEGDPALLQRARANAARNGAANVEWFAANLFEPAKFTDWDKQRYDLVLLDPPRAGACELLERLDHWRPRRVVYISCHPGSLARDAQILVHTRGFTLVSAGVMDMFPHTDHVESIAVFERPASQGARRV
jgi:23S rRNA (uracil1939-C5)-methyltransferase